MRRDVEKENIIIGMKNLNIDEILFDEDQLTQIRFGLWNKLSQEQILVYSDPKFKANQMRQIRLGFENGLSQEQVQTYADLKYDAGQMQDIREQIEEGLRQEQYTLTSSILNKDDDIDIDAIETPRTNLNELVHEDIKQECR